MIDKEFIKLCDYCDKILFKYSNKISVIAYSRLHIIKNHPELNHIYINKNKKRINQKNTFFKIFSFFKDILISNSNAYFKEKKKVNVLILSSLVNINHLNHNDDFYFGKIQKKLNKIKLSSKIILRNFTKYSEKKLFQNLKLNKVILSNRTIYVFEFIYLLIALKEYFRFFFFIKKNKINKFKNFFTFKSFIDIIYNFRLSSQIIYLIRIYRPKYLIITFEGHAWERVLISKIRTKFKNIKIYAYQFSTITKNHHSLFRPLGKKFDPDCIFSTNKFTKKIFDKKYKCPVKVIGSNKLENYSSQNKKRIKKNSVLILPEAFPEETNMLLKFAIDISKIYKEFNFYIRLHPMYNPEDLKIKIKNHKNFQFSNVIIKEDFNRCDIVLFRGSASVIEATAYGLKPIYYGKYDQCNINPIFESLNRKFYVNQPSKFKNAINSFNQLDIKKIRSYSKNYFEKMKINKRIFNI